jgi:NAD+ diphosphatase
VLVGVDVPTLLAVTPEGAAVFAADGSAGADGAARASDAVGGATTTAGPGSPRGAADAGAGRPDGAPPAAPARVPFRDVLADLDPGEAALVVQAVALRRWQEDHRFCGRCGTPTELRTAGHRLVCQGCGTRHHPRTDPVATMLVTDGGDRCLLSRRRGAKEKVWSCLAGFVEPGETPEQTVVRETMEEVGLRVVRVEGFGSQPWPVPYELMIGHRAVVVPREPVVDPELRAARWWDREELRAAIAADDVRLPPPYTIGNHAISVWLAEG